MIAAQTELSRARYDTRTLLVCLLFLLLSLARAAEPTPVKLTQPKRADIHRWIALPGTLKANQQATLYAKVAGYFTKVAVDKGNTVKADQLLADVKKY